MWEIIKALSALSCLLMGTIHGGIAIYNMHFKKEPDYLKATCHFAASFWFIHASDGFK